MGMSIISAESILVGLAYLSVDRGAVKCFAKAKRKNSIFLVGWHRNTFAYNSSYRVLVLPNAGGKNAKYDVPEELR